jgi:predicted component of type VI protein secretion system
MEAEIVRRRGRYFLLPLRVCNGTRVNETLLRFRKEIELRHGDRIYVGASEVRGFWLEFSCEPEVSESKERDETA